MKKVWDVIWDFAVITFGTTIAAAAVFFFLMPSKVSVGSISGLAIVLANFIPLSVSVITMIFNVGLLAISFVLIGKDFGTKTVYTAILLPIIIGIFEVVFPDNQSIMGDPFLDVICYDFLVSVGIAMLFNRNASSGGLDIVAKLMNKFFHMEIGSAMSLAGMAVAVSSIFVSDMKIVVLGILGTYINGIVVDHFIFGFDMKKRVCIVSEKEEEIRSFILNELHSGATVYEAYGAYNMEERREIITIVDKNEYAKLMAFIEKTDENAFVTIYTVNKIIYKPKK